MWPTIITSISPNNGTVMLETIEGIAIFSISEFIILRFYSEAEIRFGVRICKVSANE